MPDLHLRRFADRPGAFAGKTKADDVLIRRLTKTTADDFAALVYAASMAGVTIIIHPDKRRTAAPRNLIAVRRA